MFELLLKVSLIAGETSNNMQVNGLRNSDRNNNQIMKKIASIIIATLFASQVGAQVSLVKDLIPGTDQSLVELSESYGATFIDNSTLYFMNEADTFVWRTDGTSNGTQRVFSYSFMYPYKPYAFAAVGDKLFFARFVDNDTTWLMYAEKNNDYKVHHVKRFQSIGNGYPSGAYQKCCIEYKGKLLLNAEEQQPVFANKTGKELWESDGTINGTKILADLAYGGFGSYLSSNPMNFFAAYGKVYFTAALYTAGGAKADYTIWETDGTKDGTVQNKGGIISFGTSYPTIRPKWYGNYVYFDYEDFSITTPFIHHIIKLKPGTIYSSATFYRLMEYEFMNGKIYVSGIKYSNGPADTTGVELYSVDTGAFNMTATTTLVKNINRDGFGLAGPGNLTHLNGKLYFSIYTSVNDPQSLWVTDGSGPGTFKLRDINVSEMNVCDDHLYIVRNDTAKGIEITVMDPNDTSFIDMDQRAGRESFMASGNSIYFKALNNTLLFMAFDSSSGVELWRTCSPTVGIESIATEFQLSYSLYPNPFNNVAILEIDRSFDLESAFLKIIDIRGQVLRVSQIEKNMVEISRDGLASGMYFFTLSNSAGSTIKGKFIID